MSKYSNKEVVRKDKMCFTNLLIFELFAKGELNTEEKAVAVAITKLLLEEIIKIESGCKIKKAWKMHGFQIIKKVSSSPNFLESFLRIRDHKKTITLLTFGDNIIRLYVNDERVTSICAKLVQESKGKIKLCPYV